MGILYEQRKKKKHLATDIRTKMLQHPPTELFYIGLLFVETNVSSLEKIYKKDSY